MEIITSLCFMVTKRIDRC